MVASSTGCEDRTSLQKSDELRRLLADHLTSLENQVGRLPDGLRNYEKFDGFSSCPTRLQDGTPPAAAGLAALMGSAVSPAAPGDNLDPCGAEDRSARPLFNSSDGAAVGGDVSIQVLRASHGSEAEKEKFETTPARCPVMMDGERCSPSTGCPTQHSEDRRGDAAEPSYALMSSNYSGEGVASSSESPTPRSHRINRKKPTLTGSGVVGSFIKPLLHQKSHASLSSSTKTLANLKSGSSTHSLGISKFEVLPAWHNMEDKNRNIRNHTVANTAKSTDLHDDSDFFAAAFGISSGNTGFLVATPNSPHRVLWDIMSLLCVSYDMFSIPLIFFDLPSNSGTLACTWFIRFFWTVDIPLSFLTGFMRADGSVETRIGPICKRYMRCWLWLDLLVVGSDWVDYGLSDGSGGSGVARTGRTARITRVLRILRLMRLLRVAKLQEVIAVLQERISSEWLIIMTDILKILMTIVWFSHVFACLWYGIGVSAADGNREESWTNMGVIDNKDLDYKYVTSIHWALSQFMGGMDEVQPKNLSERIYTVAALLVGFVCATSFVSRLTSSMTRLEIISGRDSTQVSVMRRYLRQNNISRELTIRVQRNAQHAILEQQRFMPEDKVELLQLVSEPLRSDIHCELYRPVLEVHPFFQKWAQEHHEVVRNICHRGLSVMTLSLGDVLFTEGEAPSQPKMYFVCTGTLRYVLREQGACAEEELQSSQHVRPGQWLSEAVLWTTWSHCGVLTAMTECRLLALDTQAFQDIVLRYRTGSNLFVRVYAQEFVAALNASNAISDLFSLDPAEYPTAFAVPPPNRVSVRVRPDKPRTPTSILPSIPHLPRQTAADSETGKRSALMSRLARVTRWSQNTTSRSSNYPEGTGSCPPSFLDSTASTGKDRVTMGDESTGVVAGPAAVHPFCPEGEERASGVLS